MMLCTTMLITRGPCSACASIALNSSMIMSANSRAEASTRFHAGIEGHNDDRGVVPRPMGRQQINRRMPGDSQLRSGRDDRHVEIGRGEAQRCACHGDGASDSGDTLGRVPGRGVGGD